MSKIIVYHFGETVTGYEIVETNMLEAMRIGLAGAEAVTFDRAVRQLGLDVVATLTKHSPRKTAEEALTAIAMAHAAERTEPDGQGFILVDRLPSGEFEGWKVQGGKVVA